MSSVPVEVSNFFLAMQAGKAGDAAMQAAFAEDAVYEEPFSGEMRRRDGRDAIMAAMRAGWEYPLEDVRIEITPVSTGDGEVVVDWTCHSPSLPGGAGSGNNRFVLKGGRIARLVTTLDGTEEENG